MPPSVLILSAAYGSGHVHAARALERALREIEPGVCVEIVEYFETFVSVAWSKVTRASYLSSITYAPQLYGVFYNLTEQVQPDSLIQRALNLIGRDNLEEHLRRHHYDVIVSVYPTPSGALSELRGHGRIDVPFATLVTDYAVHSQWIHPNCDLFMIAAPDVAVEIAARGIPPSRIAVTGLPVDPKFSVPVDRLEAMRSFGLDPDRFTILIVAGAFGATPGAKEELQALLKLEGDWQAVFVCGKNDRLFRSVSSLIPDRLKDRIQVTRFVTDMDVLLAAADVLVTKAGGLTVSEALVRGVPMVIFRPIPGQEEFNTQYLVRHDASLVAGDKKSLRQALGSLIEDPIRHQEMRRAAASLGRPDAALRAAQATLALARSRKASSTRSSRKGIKADTGRVRHKRHKRKKAG